MKAGGIFHVLVLPLLLAIQFLTRLPVSGAIPALTEGQLKTGLRRAVLWFPLVGGIVGLVGATVLWGAGMLWPPVVCVVVLLIVEARLTGAFHEDAVADFCDGFGGGMTAQRIHEIMKDSRIGSYGALGLLLAVGLRAALLIALPQVLLVPAVLASAAFGRWMAVAVMVMVPPVVQAGSLARDIGQRPGAGVLLGASVLGLPFMAPLALAVPVAAAGAIALSLLFLLWFRPFLLRHLGGVSGDCLGFAVYAGQLFVLLGAAAQWPVQ